jgi:DNA-binding NarL/FixJ family response regulator
MICSAMWPMLMVMAYQHGNPQSRAVRVLVAARPRATRSALQQVVESQPGVDLIGVVTDLAGTVRFMGDLRPDVVLIERALLGRPGLPWLPALAKDAPGASIYVVGMGDHPRLEAQVRRAGGAGYIRLNEADETVPAVLATPVAA